MHKVKIFLASIVWLTILAIGVLLYRFWWAPAAQAQAEKKQQEVVQETSGTSSYKVHIKLGLDAFSGYAILRSSEFAADLKSAGIKVESVDDGADYKARLNALAEGRLQMAAFPIDALLSACDAKKSLPATIVSVIDETRGADALVAYKEKFPRVDSLNSRDVKFVLVGGSPSETLFRVLMHDFRLDQVTSQSMVSVATADDLLKRYKAAQPSGNEVFITWEPIVSQILANDATGSLIDSSRQSGYIVDALVVSRDFLIKNPDSVKRVLESYFRTLYGFRDRAKLIDLIKRDAKTQGVELTAGQAAKLVDGIQWKNTQENFAHFGLRPGNVPLIEDVIDRIKGVLLDTRGISADPTGGQSAKLFYEAALKELHASGFYPGADSEEVRGLVTLRALSDDEWNQLVSVGTLSQAPLVFARGRDTLTEASKVSLGDLVEKLKSWPSYYVKVIGSAGSKGDLDANRKLALQRAEAAAQYLREQGVSPDRIRAVSDNGSGEKSGDMSVSFVFGQLPY